jgi:hypothetical protein
MSSVYSNYMLNSSDHVSAMPLLTFVGNTSRGMKTPSDLNLPAGCALTNSWLYYSADWWPPTSCGVRDFRNHTWVKQKKTVITCYTNNHSIFNRTRKTNADYLTNNHHSNTARHKRHSMPPPSAPDAKTKLRAGASGSELLGAGAMAQWSHIQADQPSHIIPIPELDELQGRAVALAVSRWLPTAAARVRVRAQHVGFVVDKAALGQGFS